MGSEEKMFNFLARKYFTYQFNTFECGMINKFQSINAIFVRKKLANIFMNTKFFLTVKTEFWQLLKPLKPFGF